MHQKLQQMLKAYSAVAGTVATSALTAGAQIVYTDIPDVTYDMDNTGYTFDLNGDTYQDFTFFILKSGSGSNLQNQVLGFGTNSVYEIAGQIGSSNKIYVEALEKDAVIGENMSWHSFDTSYSYFWILGQHLVSSSNAYNYGQWLGAKDKYAGLRIRFGSETYYGWARLDVDSNAEQFTLKDYAYQSLPDSSIMAGDTGTFTIGIGALPAINGLQIYSSQKFVVVTNSEAANRQMSIRMFDLAGRRVKSVETTEAMVRMELPELTEGIYLVTVETASGTLSRKVFIR